MSTKHTHELAASYMMGILDYDTLKVGCHECGPQWVITINWIDRTLQISWVNVQWSLYFDQLAGRLTVEGTPENDAHQAQGS